MSEASDRLDHAWTAADVLERFGPLPLSRILREPAPGTATERDLLEIQDREGRLVELVEGVLVEKTVGFRESWLAARLVELVGAHVRRHRLGIVTGADGACRLAAGLVRVPDAAFVGWERLPSREGPREPRPDLVPHLAVEVLSRGNTDREMQRKLEDYLASGVRMAWLVDPESRTVSVHAPGAEPLVLGDADALDGGDVLPGFRLELPDLFADPARAD